MLGESRDDGRHNHKLGDFVGLDVAEKLEEVELGHNVDWESAPRANSAVQHLPVCVVET